MFDRWFASLLVLDEREAHNLSCQLEPLSAQHQQMLLNNSNQSNQSNGSQSNDSKKHYNSGGHRKNDSITSNSSSGAGSQFYCDINNLSYR